MSTDSSGSGSWSRSPRFQIMLSTPRRSASARARVSTSRERSMAVTRRAQRAASIVRYPSPHPRSATSTGGNSRPSARRPGRPAPAGHELLAFVAGAMLGEVLFPQPPHLFEARIVGARGRRLAFELLAEPGPEPGTITVAIDESRREAVPGEGAGPLFDDEPGFSQQAEMPRHAGLGHAQHAGQLRHVERLADEHANQAEPRVVAQEPQERGRIHQSINLHVLMHSDKPPARRPWRGPSGPRR